MSCTHVNTSPAGRRPNPWWISCTPTSPFVVYDLYFYRVVLVTNPDADCPRGNTGGTWPCRLVDVRFISQPGWNPWSSYRRTDDVPRETVSFVVTRDADGPSWRDLFQSHNTNSGVTRYSRWLEIRSSLVYMFGERGRGLGRRFRGPYADDRYLRRSVHTWPLVEYRVDTG